MGIGVTHAPPPVAAQSNGSTSAILALSRLPFHRDRSAKNHDLTEDTNDRGSRTPYIERQLQQSPVGLSRSPAQVMLPPVFRDPAQSLLLGNRQLRAGSSSRQQRVLQPGATKALTHTQPRE